MAEMDRRLKQVQDDGKRQQQQSVERMLLLERIMQRETDERANGDIEVRQELSQVLLAVKAVSKQEATHRLGMQRELHAELQSASKALQEQARAVHDNAQLQHTRVQDQLQEEKMLREEAGRSVQRQVDAFLRNYENERNRLAKTVHDAVTHMSERTTSAHTISKRLQEESTEVKRLALRLQEEAAFGLKSIAEKVEEGLRSLRAAQDRQGAQMVTLKDDVHITLKEQREKTSAMESRVQGAQFTCFIGTQVQILTLLAALQGISPAMSQRNALRVRASLRACASAKSCCGIRSAKCGVPTRGWRQPPRKQSRPSKKTATLREVKRRPPLPTYAQVSLDRA